MIRLLDLLFNMVFFGSTLCFFYSVVLKARYSFLKNLLIAAIAVAALFGAMWIINKVFPSKENVTAGLQFLGIAMLMCVFFVYSIFAYEGKIWQKLLASAGFLLLMIITVCATAVISTLIVGDSSFVHDDSVDVSAADLFFDFFMFLVFSFVVFVFSLIWKRIKKQFVEKSLKFMILIPANYMLLFVLEMPRISDMTAEDFARPVWLIAIAFIIVNNVVLYKAIADSSQNEEMRIQLREMEYEREAQYNYYRNIEANSREIMKYKHDFKNTLMVAYRMVENGADSDAAKELLDRLQEKNDSIDIPVYCQDSLINAILWDKSKKAAELGVTFETDIKIKESSGIDRLDACCLFVNLIDNAIRGAEKLKGIVSVKCRAEYGKLLIKIENSSEHVEIKNSVIPTTKSDKKHHGYGMDIVGEIIRKYDGDIAYSCNDGKFICAAALYNKAAPQTASGGCTELRSDYN